MDLLTITKENSWTQSKIYVETFCENSQQLKAVNYFRKNALLHMFGCVLITAPHTIFISALSHLFVTVEFLYSLSNLFEWESLCNKEVSCWSILSSLWLHCNLQSVSLFGYLSLIYFGVPFNVSFSLTLTLTVWLWLLYILSLKKTSLETYFAFNDNIQNLKHFD